MNMTVTNIDTGRVLIGDNTFLDDTYTAAGVGELKEGTILARAATGKLVPYVKGAGDSTGVPVRVMSYAVILAGAGDIPVRPALAGKFHLQRLVIAADGDASNVDNSVIDLLQSAGILAIPTTELNILDNQ